MAYDLEGARAAGISDARSAEYLAQEFDYDLEGARAAGLSDTRIVEYLATQERDGFFSGVGEEWRRGVAETEAGLLQKKAEYGELTPEEQYELDRAKHRVQAGKDEDRGLISAIAQESAKMAGNLAPAVPNALQRGMQGAMAGGSAAAIAGQLGPQIATPEEIVTVPAAAASGFGAGFSAGMAEALAAAQQGRMTAELKEAGASEGVARVGGAVAGVAEGALEMVGLHLVAAPFKHLIRQGAKAKGRELVEAAGVDTVKESLKRAALTYLASSGGEVVTENMQELAEATVSTVVGNIENIPELQNDLSAEELVPRLVEVTKATLLATVIPGGLGAGGTYVKSSKPRWDVSREADLTRAENRDLQEETRRVARDGVNPEALRQDRAPYLKPGSRVTADNMPAYLEEEMKQEVRGDGPIDLTQEQGPQTVWDRTADLREAQAAKNAAGPAPQPPAQEPAPVVNSMMEPQGRTRQAPRWLQREKLDLAGKPGVVSERETGIPPHMESTLKSDTQRAVEAERVRLRQQYGAMVDELSDAEIAETIGVTLPEAGRSAPRNSTPDTPQQVEGGGRFTPEQLRRIQTRKVSSTLPPAQRPAPPKAEDPVPSKPVVKRGEIPEGGYQRGDQVLWLKRDDTTTIGTVKKIAGKYAFLDKQGGGTLRVRMDELSLHQPGERRQNLELLGALEDTLRGAEARGTSQSEDATVGFASTFPKWFQDSGVGTKAKALAAINKYRLDKASDLQTQQVEAMLDGYRQVVVETYGEGALDVDPAASTIEVTEQTPSPEVTVAEQPEGTDTLEGAAASTSMVSDLVAWVAGRTESPLHRAIAERILPFLQDTGLVTVSEGKAIPGGAPQTLQISKGVFFRTKGGKQTVYLKDSTFTENGMNEETVLHEALHAATLQRINEGNKVKHRNTALGKAVADLYQLQHQVVNYLNQKKADGTLTEYEEDLRTQLAASDVHELVAYGFTDFEFQVMLEDIRVGSKSAWSKFVDTLKQLLGLDGGTALDELIRVTDEILEADMPGGPLQEAEAARASLAETISRVAALGGVETLPRYFKVVRDGGWHTGTVYRYLPRRDVFQQRGGTTRKWLDVSASVDAWLRDDAGVLDRITSEDFSASEETARSVRVVDGETKSALTRDGAKEVAESLADSKPTNQHEKSVLQAMRDRATSVIDRIDRYVGSGLGTLEDVNRYLAERYRALGKLYDISKESRRLYDVFKVAGKADREAIYEYWTTQNATPDAISEAYRADAVQAKQQIISIGEMLVERGILGEDVFQANKGQYLPRVYLEYIMKEGGFSGNTMGLNLGYSRKRKNKTMEERAARGEIRDPAFLIARAYNIPKRDMAILDWLEYISRNADWVLPGSLVEWSWQENPGYQLGNITYTVNEDGSFNLTKRTNSSRVVQYDKVKPAELEKFFGSDKLADAVRNGKGKPLNRKRGENKAGRAIRHDTGWVKLGNFTYKKEADGTFTVKVRERVEKRETRTNVLDADLHTIVGEKRAHIMGEHRLNQRRSAEFDNQDWQDPKARKRQVGQQVRGMPKLIGGKMVTPFWLEEQAVAIRKRSDMMPEGQREEALKVARRMEELAEPYRQQDVPEGWVEMPRGKKYGPLAGMVVRREIYNDITNNMKVVLGEKTFWDRLAEKGRTANALWKWTKTAANAPGQVRNGVSNMLMVGLSGTNWLKIPALYVRAIRSIRNNTFEWRQAQRYGVEAASFSNTELNRIETEFLELQRRQGEAGFMLRAQEVFAKVYNTTGDWYQLNESVHKTMIMIDRMDRGMSAEQAAMEAHKWLFDYGQVPALVRQARTSPLGIPFLTYSIKVAPRLLDAAINNPLHALPFVGLMFIPWGIAQALDVDEDDVDNLMKALPEWLQTKNHAYILPIKGDDGRWTVLDLGYYFPWSQWGEAINQGIKLAGKDRDVLADTAKMMSAVGISGAPLYDLIAAAKTGIDPFTGREIVDEYATPQEKVGAVFAYLWNMAMPSMLGVAGHGSLGHAINATVDEMPDLMGDFLIGATWADPVDKMDRPRSSLSSAALRLVGANTYNYSAQETRAARLMQMKGDIAKLKGGLKRRLSDPATSTEQARRLQEYYIERIRRVAERMREYAQETDSELLKR